jgi:hypothetical protein
MAAIMSIDEPRPRGTNDAYGIRASNSLPACWQFSYSSQWQSTSKQKNRPKAVAVMLAQLCVLSAAKQAGQFSP